MRALVGSHALHHKNNNHEKRSTTHRSIVNDSNSNSNSNSTTSTSTSSTPNATPTRGGTRSLSTPNRPPLLSRDRNAMMRAQKSPLISKRSNANMPPYEKQPSSRPLMPSLSGSAKSSSRPPLTPRVAGSASAPPAAVTTPLSRTSRTPHPESNTTPNHDITTPVSTFLNSNITPRSSSRKNRVDSANSTPTGTPTGTPAPELGRFQDLASYGSGMASVAVDNDVPKRPIVTFGPARSEMGSSRSPAISNPGDSKFFFASDARQTQPQRPLVQSKNSSFFYASGEAIPQQPQFQSTSSSVIGSAIEERSQPKFFHANGTPDIQASPSPHFPPPKSSSVVSNSTRMTASRQASTPGTLSPTHRPLSPTKLHSSVPNLRNAPSLPPPVTSRPPTVIGGQSAGNLAADRRSSIEPIPVTSNHERSISSGSMGASPCNVFAGSSNEMPSPSTPLSLITSTVAVSTPEEGTATGSQDSDLPELQSPVMTGQSMEQLNELAANARRERKVLDLEITNSSLAAINRTLEREMRKQTAELRRYRRLSRSGRLSIATTDSLRTSSLSTDGGDLSDMSEEESDEDSEISSESDSIDEGSLSPSAMAESDLRHRKRDEKRLQLDLSKHQQLLIDSQKINQSLKRCLGWTEELINEGKKALEYHVRVSDIELGGRVLAPDELEGDNEDMKDMGTALVRKARKAAQEGLNTIWERAGKDDRDSGIELDGSQKSAPSKASST